MYATRASPLSGPRGRHANAEPRAVHTVLGSRIIRRMADAERQGHSGQDTAREAAARELEERSQRRAPFIDRIITEDAELLHRLAQEGREDTH
jgi:hypothetical protein